MITLSYHPQNPYGRYGMDHFVRRSGIPFETGESAPEGSLSYATSVEDQFAITVRGNTIQDRLCGQVSYRDTLVPVCEIPDNTGHGDLDLAFFDAAGTNYPCITKNAEGIDIGIDIFQETGYLLSGHYDRIWGNLDEPGRRRVASCPAADILENILMGSILEGCRSLRIPLVRKSPWPDAKKFAVCLTHDVDEVRKTYQWLTRPVRCLRRGDFRGFGAQVRSLFRRIGGAEPYWTFNEIASIENHFNAKSTFFFLKESGKTSFFSPHTWNLYGRCHSYREPGVLEAIRVVSGYDSEVAVHGSFYSYTVPGLIKSETRELESLIGKKVFGTRQHHLNLCVPQTWDYQRDAGLQYDSSLGYKDRLGFRWGTSYPFFPLTGETPHAIQEIPLIIMDIVLLSRKDPVGECLALAGEVERVSGVLTLLWHPPSFNDLEVSGSGEIYSRIIEQSVNRGAWVTSAKEILQWQQRRDSLGISLMENGNDFVIPVNSGGNSYLSVYLPFKTKPELSGNAIVLGKENDPTAETECLHLLVNAEGDTGEIRVSLK